MIPSERSLRSRAPLIMIAILVPLLVTTAGFGLFMPTVYEGLVPSHYIAESQGQDLVSLFVAVPLLLLSIVWIRRGLIRGDLVASGVLAYVAYVSIIYAYGGVANELYFAYVASLGLSVFALILLLSRADGRSLDSKMIDGLPIRSVSIFLWILSGLLVLVWGGLGASAIAAGASSEANTILVTDLAFVIPGFVISGIWLWRRKPRGVVFAGMMLALNVVLNGSIVAGQIMRYVTGIGPTWALAGLFGTVALVAAGLSVQFFRKLSDVRG